jgi:hypothetical protein
MKRLAANGLVLSLALGLTACATYRDDLDRASVHYHANEYAESLALLAVVENDIDSLSEGERARYAYYRGMSYFRLNQLPDARHWLGRAAAREKATAGSLSKEEITRVNDTLDKLNISRWGGASTPAAEGEKAGGEKAGGDEPDAAKGPDGADGDAPAEGGDTRASDQPGDI